MIGLVFVEEEAATFAFDPRLVHISIPEFVRVSPPRTPVEIAVVWMGVSSRMLLQARISLP